MNDSELTKEARGVWAIIGLAVEHVERGEQQDAKKVLSEAQRLILLLLNALEPDTLQAMPVAVAHEEGTSGSFPVYEASDLSCAERLVARMLEGTVETSPELPPPPYESSQRADVSEFPAALPVSREPCDCGEADCIHDALLNLH